MSFEGCGISSLKWVSCLKMFQLTESTTDKSKMQRKNFSKACLSEMWMRKLGLLGPAECLEAAVTLHGVLTARGSSETQRQYNQFDYIVFNWNILTECDGKHRFDKTLLARPGCIFCLSLTLFFLNEKPVRREQLMLSVRSHQLTVHMSDYAEPQCSAVRNLRLKTALNMTRQVQ